MKEEPIPFHQKNTFPIEDIFIQDNELWYEEIAQSEEEEASVPCCIKKFDADPVDAAGVRPSRITLPNGNRREIFRAGQIRMQFRLKVGRKEDVSKISVIQYIKGATLTHNGRNQPVPYPKPHKNWDWKEGNDGYRVDMNRNNRCWPEASKKTPIGLRRNENTRIITWYDEPGLNLEYHKQEFRKGKIKEADFPIELKSSFKTDVICSVPKPCGKENARNRKRFSPTWTNKVVASVKWDLSVKIYAFNIGIWIFTSMADNKPKITRGEKKIFKECDGAM